MTMRSIAACVVVLAISSPQPALAQSGFGTRCSTASWIPRVAPSSGSGSYSSINAYTYDDGVSEDALGFMNCPPPNLATLCWLQKFTAVGAADTIAIVKVAWGTASNPGGSPPAGTLATVGIWSDPNQDGNPTDALLLSSALTVITNPDSDVLQVVAIPPVVVSGVFFVGAFTVQACNVPALSKFPASMDKSSASLGRAWVCAADPSTTFVHSPLGANNVPPVELDALALSAVWLLRAEGFGPPPNVYCTAKVNALGCTPAISFTGSPVAANSAGFTVRGANVRNQKSGLLFYGMNTGAAAIALSGGTLCVKTPIKRTQAVSSGGSPLPTQDCSGVYSIDMNAFAHQAGSPVPPAILRVPGTQMNVQWWGRDPGLAPPNNTTLTNGLQYTIL
jgi:hypothetical protein